MDATTTTEIVVDLIHIEADRRSTEDAPVLERPRSEAASAARTAAAVAPAPPDPDYFVG